MIPKRKEKTVGKEIRVLLMTDDFEYTTHSELRVSSEQGLILLYGNQKENITGIFGDRHCAVAVGFHINL